MTSRPSSARSTKLDKLAKILLTLLDTPSIPDDVTARTGLIRTYIQPRMSEMTRLGLIHAGKLTPRTVSGRPAHIMHVQRDVASYLLELADICETDAALVKATAEFIGDFIAEWELQRMWDARRMMEQIDDD